MVLTNFAFIVFGSDYNAEDHQINLTSDSLTTKVVGVGSIQEAISAAHDLVADGVQLIELCGWFGPKGAAQIIDAVGEDVPVGFVTHGPDSIKLMYELFKD